MRRTVMQIACLSSLTCKGLSQMSVNTLWFNRFHHWTLLSYYNSSSEGHKCLYQIPVQSIWLIWPNLPSPGRFHLHGRKRKRKKGFLQGSANSKWTKSNQTKGVKFDPRLHASFQTGHKPVPPHFAPVHICHSVLFHSVRSPRKLHDQYHCSNHYR